MVSIFTSSHTRKLYKTKKLRTSHPDEHGVFHRPQLIPGWNQDNIETLKVLLVGAGGLGGETGEGLARKGVGEIHIFDPDIVELSNLSRQKFFKRDLYKNKAERLARNLVDQATGASLIAGYPLRIQEATIGRTLPRCHIAVVLVDDEATRVFCSQHFETPVIFAAVGVNAERCYVMVQESHKACYRCVIPEPADTSRVRCFTPSCIDPAKIIGGIVLFAIDSLFTDRTRRWNYKEVNLSGFPQDRSEYIERRPDCALCGKR